MESDARIAEITEGSVRVKQGREVLSFKADSVVLAMGMKPNKDLFNELKAGPYELYSVGDCVEPRRIADAVAEANQVAHRI